MKHIFVADLKPGSSVDSTFLVRDKDLRTSRNGSAHLDVRLGDRTGLIRAILQDATDQNLSFEVNDVVRAEGEVEDHQGMPQLQLRSITRSAQPVDLGEYLPRSRRDPEALYGSVLERLKRMREGPLRTLALAVMEDTEIAQKYKLAPAAVFYHHAYLGGLLEHVHSLVGLADRIADHYSFLNRELLIAGLVLHDLGKIDELCYDGAFRYSSRGRLVGHMAIALEIVREKIHFIPGFPESLKNQIEHIILSHHGKLELGSAKEPMFPEALVVHHLDDLDSKLESMRAQYEAEQGQPGDWTARNPALRRELFKTQMSESSRAEASGKPGSDSP